MTSPLRLVILALIGTVLKIVLQQEYARWARRLAQGLIKLAGFIHRPQAAKWWADLCYAQLVEKDPGLL